MADRFEPLLSQEEIDEIRRDRIASRRVIFLLMVFVVVAVPAWAFVIRIAVDWYFGV